MTNDDFTQHADLIHEWNESREFIARTKRADIRDMEVFNRISQAQRDHLNYMADYYNNKHYTLAKLGCVIAYLDDKLVVYAKYGNARVLTSLKEWGIHLGSVFSMQNLGHNIAIDAMASPFETVRRIGHEQYANLFGAYVCMARYAKGSPYGYRGTNLIFIPIDRYTDNIGIMVENILNQEDISYQNKIFYPYTHLRSELLEKSAEFSGEAFILTDVNGMVVFSSHAFEQATGKSINAYDVDRHSLNSFIPELGFVWSLLKSGRPVNARSASLLRGKERLHFFVDAYEIRNRSNLLGYRVLLRTLSQINKQATPLLGSAVIYSFDSIIGESAGITRCKEIAFQAARSDSNVLITGESGTGKELIAQAIHHASVRKEKPFVALNCGALPKELVASELFGHEEGAFTGAKRGGHVGKAEQANGGTLFLDEIGEMPLDAQVYLLRFLDSGEITRVGGRKVIPLNVRIIAATNRDLAESTQSGMFRLDLYYRLNVLRIMLPPLRERTGDIQILLPHFLSSISKRLGKSAQTASDEVVSLFEQKHWPGNLRELRNVVERCVNLLPEGIQVLNMEYLPDDILIESAASRALPVSDYSHSAYENADNIATLLKPQSLHDRNATSDAAKNASLSESGDAFDYHTFEKRRIEEALITHRGNKKAVAAELHMSRTTLYARIKDYGIIA